MMSHTHRFTQLHSPVVWAAARAWGSARPQRRLNATRSRRDSMLCSYDAASCRDDRDRSIRVGRGRSSERPLPTAMRAKPLTASRAARVANKNAVSDMGSVLRFAPPQTLRQSNAAMQQKPVTIVFCVCLARDATGRPGRERRRGGRRGRCFWAFTPIAARGRTTSPMGSCPPRRPGRGTAGQHAGAASGAAPNCQRYLRTPTPWRWPATRGGHGGPRPAACSSGEQRVGEECGDVRSRGGLRCLRARSPSGAPRPRRSCASLGSSRAGDVCLPRTSGC
jgi:hypothetical protein